ncbi:putative receptor protein kinase ZmPK1 [Ziziphus jujuba]|uniref:Receptor-like serine/threonine-protein kinase n=1 Tax=Ziziphus jujuba TaxID=326968 RepID=A0ABM3ZTA7_ZIZJJ|nr:putative receptor protein kinase ZmPK1 [Ziziphus jujuba]
MLSNNQTLKYLLRAKYMACLFIFFHVLSYATSSSFSSDTLHEGASLSVRKPDDVLVSSNGVFSAGFHYVGQNRYCFAIWFNLPPYNYSYANRTVVWMANRDKPVNNGKHSKLSLQKDGNLVLNDDRRLIVWATDTVSVSSTFLHLLDTANLVLKDYFKVDVVLWQSFYSSTDTLLPLQPLTKSTKLISSRSQSNFSTGFYIFTFSDDNLLRLIFDKNEVSSVYWPPLWLSFWEVGRSTSNDSKIAMLNSLGNFTSSDGFRFLSTDYGSNMVQRRLRMDDDGNLRLYSRKIDGIGWYVSWQAILDPCMINGICGINGICTNDPSSGRSCSCFPGHKMKDPSDWTEGCVQKFNLSCEKKDSKFIKLAGVRLNGHDYGFFPNYTLSQCQDLCSSVCNCRGILYAFSEDTGTYNYYPKTLLLNGYRTTRFYGDIYMRLPKSYYLPLPEDKTSTTKESVLQCFDEPEFTIKEEEEENDLVKHLLWFSVGTGGFQIICFVSVWSLPFIRSKSRNSESDGAHYLIGVTAGMCRKYSYGELKKATRGFKEEIGWGYGGIVYKGVLPNDRVAAVKLLINDEANNHDQGEAEFLAEVSTLGRLNHMHLMKIWGYCTEGKHRLLVFEYLERGSLKRNLSSNVLDWGMRFKIAFGTAKGLTYLHEECLEWILHCDVKPDNILLDSDYSPKVADFGLCKLLKRGELNKSEFSRIRGTRGYLAPEWVSNQPITSKVDVYSYGLVVLEMLTGKSPTTDVQIVNDTGEIEDKRSLVSWARKNIEETSSDEIVVLLEKIVDPSLGEEYDLKEMEKLLEVAMKCVEVERGARPTMRQVVEMLLD